MRPLEGFSQASQMRQREAKGRRGRTTATASPDADLPSVDASTHAAFDSSSVWGRSLETLGKGHTVARWTKLAATAFCQKTRLRENWPFSAFARRASLWAPWNPKPGPCWGLQTRKPHRCWRARSHLDSPLPLPSLLFVFSRGCAVHNTLSPTTNCLP